MVNNPIERTEDLQAAFPKKEVFQILSQLVLNLLFYIQMDTKMMVISHLKIR
jgi:hypothetical protein